MRPKLIVLIKLLDLGVAEGSDLGVKCRVEDRRQFESPSTGGVEDAPVLGPGPGAGDAVGGPAPRVAALCLPVGT